MVIAQANNDNPECKLSETRPNYYDFAPEANIVSSDYEALIRFDGFIELEKNPISGQQKQLFMPINVERVDHELINSDNPGSGTRSRLVLSSKCSRVSIDFIESEYNIKANDFTVEIILENGDKCTCHLRDPPIWSPSRWHYACDRPQTYPCYPLQRFSLSVGNVSINVLEFEISHDDNSRKESFKSGLFVTSKYCWGISRL